MQERLLQPHALSECDVSLFETYSEQGGTRWERQPRSAFLNQKPGDGAEHWCCRNHQHRYFLEKKCERGSVHQTPPAKAINTLNAFVLFSVLSSDLRALRIPTMTARIKISPAEQTAKETLEMRFRWSDSNDAWSSGLLR